MCIGRASGGSAARHVPKGFEETIEYGVSRMTRRGGLRGPGAQEAIVSIYP